MPKFSFGRSIVAKLLTMSFYVQLINTLDLGLAMKYAQLAAVRFRYKIFIWENISNISSLITYPCGLFRLIWILNLEFKAILLIW
jgi:hypothetical protein